MTLTSSKSGARYYLMLVSETRNSLFWDIGSLKSILGRNASDRTRIYNRKRRILVSELHRKLRCNVTYEQNKKVQLVLYHEIMIPTGIAELCSKIVYEAYPISSNEVKYQCDT